MSCREQRFSHFSENLAQNVDAVCFCVLNPGIYGPSTFFDGHQSSPAQRPLPTRACLRMTIFGTCCCHALKAHRIIIFRRDHGTFDYNWGPHLPPQYGDSGGHASLPANSHPMGCWAMHDKIDGRVC